MIIKLKSNQKLLWSRCLSRAAADAEASHFNRLSEQIQQHIYRNNENVHPELVPEPTTPNISLPPYGRCTDCRTGFSKDTHSITRHPGKTTCKKNTHVPERMLVHTDYLSLNESYHENCIKVSVWCFLKVQL